MKGRPITHTPRSFHLSPTNVEGVIGKRLMVILRSPGCIYFRSENTACTFCGFRHLTSSQLEIPDEAYAEQLAAALEQVPTDGQSIIELNIYNSGNFFCDAELSARARHLVGEFLSGCNGLLAVSVDSRPEFITSTNLAEFRSAVALPQQAIFVGIGLEVFDDSIRENLLNKHFRRSTFRNSLATLQNAGYGALIYIMVKPVPMSDEDALDQVISAGAFVQEEASRLSLPYRFALEPTFVVEDTPLARLYRRGLYSPPTLELVTQAAARLAHFGPVNIGLWEEELPVLAKPDSNSRDSILAAIQAFNCSQDLSVLLIDDTIQSDLSPEFPLICS